jgi:hypothetical protein
MLLDDQENTSRYLLVLLEVRPELEGWLTQRR